MTVLPKKIAKSPPKKTAENPMKYMILELSKCGSCSVGRYNARAHLNKQHAKAEMDKIIQFKIDTEEVWMSCPSCNNFCSFKRIKWWGSGFKENDFVYLDSNGKKKIEVSEMKDITNILLKCRVESIKKDISTAEKNLNNLNQLKGKLESILASESKDKKVPDNAK